MDYRNTFDEQTWDTLIKAMGEQYQRTLDYILKACFVDVRSAPPKYPNECPCGIRSADCDYHKDA